MSRIVTSSRNIEFDIRNFEKVCRAYRKAKRTQQLFTVRQYGTGLRIALPPSTVIRIEE